MDLLYTSDGTYSIIKVGLWNVAELTTIILCACFPILPKFFHWITGKSKAKSSYHPSHSHSSKGGPSKRSHILQIPLGNNKSNTHTTNTNTYSSNSNDPTPWLDTDGDIGPAGKSKKGTYHNLDAGRSYDGKSGAIGMGEMRGRKEGAEGGGIWKSEEVRVDSALDPERGRRDFV